MATDDERREVARRLRRAWANVPDKNPVRHHMRVLYEIYAAVGLNDDGVDAIDLFDLLADLIEPSYKPDAKYEAWYNSLSHYGDKRGGPSTIRELVEEIVWTALAVDLGPNGNTDPSTGIDEGGVYTNKLFAEWEREALRLSGGIDRDALLALAEEAEKNAWYFALDHDEDELRDRLDEAAEDFSDMARRIREACGEADA